LAALQVSIPYFVLSIVLSRLRDISLGLVVGPWLITDGRKGLLGGLVLSLALLSGWDSACHSG